MWDTILKIYLGGVAGCLFVLILWARFWYAEDITIEDCGWSFLMMVLWPAILLIAICAGIKEGACYVFGKIHWNTVVYKPPKAVAKKMKERMTQNGEDRFRGYI